jgi:hypothetical protein
LFGNDHQERDQVLANLKKNIDYDRKMLEARLNAGGPPQAPRARRSGRLSEIFESMGF